MKTKAAGILWQVEREFYRWYQIEAHGPMGCHTHKVLVTAWKTPSRNNPKSGWNAKIVVPSNSSTSMVYTATTRRKVTAKALEAFRYHLLDNGEN